MTPWTWEDWRFLIIVAVGLWLFAKLIIFPAEEADYRWCMADGSTRQECSDFLRAERDYYEGTPQQ